MNRVVASIIFYLAALCTAYAQYAPYIGSGNTPVSPHVLLCAGSGKTAVECGTLSTPLPTSPSIGTTSGGIELVYRLSSSAASTNITTIRNSSARLYKITGYNTTTSVKWLRIYNRTVPPVVGTNVPISVLALPPGAFSYDTGSAGFGMTTGLIFAMTGASPDNDSTVLAAGDIVNLQFFYQ